MYKILDKEHNKKGGIIMNENIELLEIVYKNAEMGVFTVNNF